MKGTSAEEFREFVDAGQRIGASRADETQLLAMFCDGLLQIMVGAVSPGMVFRGAMIKGLTALDLAHLAARDPMAVAELMWVEEGK